jgi:hypothetical protein
LAVEVEEELGHSDSNRRWSVRRSQGASVIRDLEAVAHRQRSENDGRLGSPVPCPASERGAAPATKRKELTRSKGPAQSQFGDRLDIASCVEVEETRDENQLRTKRWSVRRSQGASEITDLEAVAHRQRSENDGRIGSPVPCPASERGAAPATERRELTRSRGPAQGQLGDRLGIASWLRWKRQEKRISSEQSGGAYGGPRALPRSQTLKPSLTANVRRQT